jgi:holliday junction DNA helicase RuvA
VYDFLDGRVAERAPRRLVLAVGGLGFELVVADGFDFPAVGESTRVWTHLVVREDAHQLYGFDERLPRQLFRLLIRVQRVGPTLALAIVGGLSPGELLDALRLADTARLSRIKGVGKRTAERVLLELRDRIDDFVAEEFGATRGAPPAVQGGVLADATRALVSIGFPEAEARRLLEGAAGQVAPDDLEGLLRFACAAARRPLDPAPPGPCPHLTMPPERPLVFVADELDPEALERMRARGLEALAGSTLTPAERDAALARAEAWWCAPPPRSTAICWHARPNCAPSAAPGSASTTWTWRPPARAGSWS